MVITNSSILVITILVVSKLCLQKNSWKKVNTIKLNLKIDIINSEK